MNVWSYSRLKAFEQCPLQFYHMKVARTYDEPETEAIRYGNLFHEAAEHYIRDESELPKGFQFAKPALDALNRFSGEKGSVSGGTLSHRILALVPSPPR